MLTWCSREGGRHCAHVNAPVGDIVARTGRSRAAEARTRCECGLRVGSEGPPGSPLRSLGAESRRLVPPVLLASELAACPAQPLGERVDDSASLWTASPAARGDVTSAAVGGPNRQPGAAQPSRARLTCLSQTRCAMRCRVRCLQAPASEPSKQVVAGGPSGPCLDGA